MVVALSVGSRTQHGAVDNGFLRALSITTTFGLCLVRLSASHGSQRSSHFRAPGMAVCVVSATQSQIEASRAQAERSERNFTALLAKLDQQEERHKDTTAALQQQLAQATNATPASGPPSAPPSRPPSAPPPAKLMPDLSLREFRAWRATWTDFFELSDGQRLSPDRQLAPLPDLSLVGDARSSWPHHPDEDYLERAAGRNRRALPPPAERRLLPGSVRTAPATSR